MRQTPGGNGLWDGIQFTRQPVDVCDYLLAIDGAGTGTVVCPSEHVWGLLFEPPIPLYDGMHQGVPHHSRVYTTNDCIVGERYVHTQPAVPWYVDKDYDFLKACPIPEKELALSWITSNYTNLPGHRLRMAFLRRIRKQIQLDLFGKGIRYIQDKWDGLAPYKYSLAVENTKARWYWTEKLADCFLAWTMPIYYGCTNISDYFPRESFVELDILDPFAPEKIREVIASDLWRRNLDAIAYARQLVLDRYQLFPFIAQEISEHEQGACFGVHLRQSVHVPATAYPLFTFKAKARRFVETRLPKGMKPAFNRLVRSAKRLRDGGSHSAV